MYIKEITLKDFRNYKDLHTSFHPRVNIFLGKNAQGKTNLLEGIYLNAMARSFKTTRDKDLIRFGEEFCRIHTVSKAFDEEMETEILITKKDHQNRRSKSFKDFSASGKNIHRYFFT